MGTQIIKAEEIQNQKGTYLIYAPPGMGKTTSAKYFPGKTLILDVDRTTRVLKGCQNIDIMKIDNVNTWDDWQATIIALEKDFKDQYDNVMVDNISELERCMLSNLGKKGKNNGVPSQGNYQEMQFRLVNSLRFLKSLDSNIILTAWETTDLYTTPEGQQFNRSYPQLNGKVLNNVMGLCDVVARLVVTPDGERGFYLAATNGVFAKNQIDDRKGCKQSELIIGAENEPAETVSD